MTDSLPTAEVAELAKEETRRLRLGAVRKMLSEMNEHQLREFVFQLYATGMACLPAWARRSPRESSGTPTSTATLTGSTLTLSFALDVAPLDAP